MGKSEKPSKNKLAVLCGPPRVKNQLDPFRRLVMVHQRHTQTRNPGNGRFPPGALDNSPSDISPLPCSVRIRVRSGASMVRVRVGSVGLGLVG